MYESFLSIVIVIVTMKGASPGPPGTLGTERPRFGGIFHAGVEAADAADAADEGIPRKPCSLEFR